MIVTCPACSTRYNLQPIALGGAGRKVRCSKCGHNWTQQPPDPTRPGQARPPGPAARSPGPVVPPPGPVPNVATEWPRDSLAAPAGRAEEEGRAPRLSAFAADQGMPGHDFHDQDPFADMGGDAPAFPEGEEAAGWRRPGRWAAIRRAARWIGFAAIVGGTATFLVAGRDTVVNLWPASARLYEALGLPVEPPGAGLQLQSVKSEQRVDDGTVMLVVEGQILNASDIERQVPPLLAVSIGPDHQPVHKWRIPVTQSHLAPGAIATFHSVERDPGVVSEVAVTFGGG